MSEKLSSSEPAVKSDEELKESVRESKELIWKENEPKRTMEYVEATEHSITHGSEYRPPDLKDSEYIKFQKLAGLPEPLIEKSEGAKICSYPCSSKKKEQIPEESDDPKDPEVPKICQLSETTSEISISNKPEDPEDPQVTKICSYPCSSKKRKQIPKESDDPKDPEVLKICQLSETISEISISNKPEDPEDPQVTKICSYPCSLKKKRQIPKESDDPKDPEVLKICQLSETMSEISISNKPEDPEDPQVTKICSYPCSSKKKRQIPKESDDPKDPEVPKICKLPKITSEISTFKLEEPEVPKICELPKTTSEISTSIKEDILKVPKVCQLPETSEISTSVKFETSEIPDVCDLCNTTLPLKISSVKFTDPEISKCQLLKEIAMSEIPTSIKLVTSKIPEIYQLPKTESECSTKSMATYESEVPKAFQPRKTMSEISTSSKPEAMSEIPTSIKLETSKIPEMYQLPKTESECSTQSMATYESEVPKASQPRKTMSEISTSSKPEAMSEISTSIKLETSKIPEMYQLPETESEYSIQSMATYESEVPKASQLRKTMSEISTSSKPEDPKIPELRRKDSLSEIFALKHGAFKEVCEFPKKTTYKIPTSNKPKDSETLKKEDSPFGISEPTRRSVLPYYNRPPKLLVESDRKYRKRVEEQRKVISCDYDYEHEKLNYSTWISIIEKSEENSDDEDTTELLPIVSGKRPFGTLNKICESLVTPNFTKRPFVLATYQLVPSLPIGLFEIFAEIIEELTKRHVVLLHEGKFHRPIPSEIADIVIMPAACNWDEGVLLPASFVFKHEQNKDKTANVYADVVVMNDCNPRIKSIMDLRGYTFVLPIERCELTCSDLLFNFLHAKGEKQIFFGNLLDAKTQIDVLDKVATNQAEAGVLDSPVVESNKYTIQGVTMKSLRILSSLGPLPPYRIMIKKTLADELIDKLANYLLTSLDDLWLEKLLPYGVLGFAENSMDKYEYLNPKSGPRKPRYY